LDNKWHSGIHPYLKNASHALKLTKLIEVIAKDYHQHENNPEHQ